MLAVVKSYGLLGLGGYKVDVEVDISQGLPKYDIVGLPDTAVKESKERVRAAVKNSGFKFPGKITITLAPANQKKEGPAFDLPIAISILCASEQLKLGEMSKFVMVGELGLDGSLKPVSGLLPILISARESGYTSFIVPKKNEEEASYIDGINVFAFDKLKDVKILQELKVRV